MALTFKGEKRFTPTGPPRWILDGWELDRLIVPMKGSIEQLNAYLASLTLWVPASGVGVATAGQQLSGTYIDSNMFLSNWVIDGHPQYPTVELNYIGKKNGRLPPDKHDTGRTGQQVSGGSLPYSLTYIAPTSRVITFSRSEINTAVVGPREPATATGIWATVFGLLAISDDTRLAALISSHFRQRAVTTANSEELVPGEYFRAEITKTNFLFDRGFGGVPPI